MSDHTTAVIAESRVIGAVEAERRDRASKSPNGRSPLPPMPAPSRRRRTPVRLFTVATAVAIAAASAAAAQTAPTPDVSRMALRASDLPSASQLVSEGYERGSRGRAYTRTFDVGGLREGHADGALVQNTIELEDDALTARAYLRAIKQAFASRSGRRALARAIAGAGGRHGRLAAKDVRFRRLRSVAVGDRGFDLRLSVRTRAGRLHAVIAFVAVDRALGMLSVTSGPRSHLAQHAVPMLRAAAAHMREGLSPQSTSPPVVSGAAAVGQTLTATTGAWNAATPPSGFAYQWQRCDASGAACAPIAGATGPSYTVSSDDVGARLRVAVTAADAAGSTVALSALIAVVS